MESADKCPELSEPEEATSCEKNSADDEKGLEDGNKDAPSLDENPECSKLNSSDTEDQPGTKKSPQNKPQEKSPTHSAENSTDCVEESSPAENPSVAEVSDKDEVTSKNVHTDESQSEVVESTNVPESEIVESTNVPESEVVESTNLSESEVVESTNLSESEVVESTNLSESEVVESSNVSEPEVVTAKSVVDDETKSAEKDPLLDQSPVSNKEDDASLNLEEKEGTNELEVGIRLDTNSEVNESEKGEDIREDTNEISEEDLSSAKQQPSPSSKENISAEAAVNDAVEDTVTNQQKSPEEQESADHSSNVDIPEKAEETTQVGETNEATAVEPMDVDDEKGTDKPLSETEEDSHAMATADVDNESRDELMEVSTHEDENDPLSSADKEKDVEMSTNEDLSQEKNRGCEVEIHTDIVKDEQFHVEEDSGDGEKSNDSSVKDKESTTVGSGDGEKNNDTVDQDKDSSKEDSGDGKKSEDSTEKDKQASKEDGPKSNDTSDQDKETGSDLTKEVPEKPSEGEDKTEDTAKTTVQDATSKEGDDDICIIPDSVSKSVKDKEKKSAEKEGPAKSPTKVQTTSDDIQEIEEVVEVEETRKVRRRYRTSLEMSMATSVDLTAPRPQRQAAKKAENQIKVLAAVESYEPPPDPKPTLTILDRVTESNPCQQCGLVTFCNYQMRSKDSYFYFCRELCYNEYQSPNQTAVPIISDSASPPPPPKSVAELERPFERTCGKCSAKINATDERVLTWETMDFCSDDCLGKYQTALGSHCANCKGAVQNSSLGKYCVRFGYNIKQFCCAGCLEEFKKGLKVCSYCQKDISSDQGGFLAPVGDKGQFKDFCTPSCMEKYEQMSSAVAPPTPCHECAVCNKLEPVCVEVLSGKEVNKLCSQPCFAAFKFVNGVVADQCDMCKKYFDKAKTENFTIFYDDAPHSFCCKTCMNVYILAKRKIVPCSWCKVKKYNFDMIKKTSNNGQGIMMCSLHCLNLYQVSASAVSARRIKCDHCGVQVWAQYHLSMSDGTMRNFCTYNCVNAFQSKFSRAAIAAGGKDDTPVPTGGPKRALSRRSVNAETETVAKGTPLPVISSVTSLAPNGEPLPAGSSVPGTIKPTAEVGKTAGKQHIIVRPPRQPKRHNRGVQVQPIQYNKGVSIKPQSCTKDTQTDDELGGKQPIIVPIPVPIYVPSPMCMYNLPTPLPVPFPLPIPIPIFIPTTRNSTKGIMKEIKRIQEKIPADPFEAELLMMAEMVAAEKKPDKSGESESEGEAPSEEPAAADGTSPTSMTASNESRATSEAGNGESQTFSPEAVDSSNTFGEDIMQMALKFASSLDEQPVDFDAAVAPSTITSGGAQNEDDASDSDADDADSTETKRPSRKRPARSSTRSSAANKRSRRLSSTESLPVPSDGSTTSTRTDAERPDANMCLKYTYGVNAWRQWVLQKNAQLEKAATSNRKLKLFKTDLLQLTSDELNYALCLFVKEVRKPNGTEYAPDTIYYLCLGIQLYLIENGRVDNIFSDPLYEKFTECLDEMSKKFCSLYDDTQYIVTRVEEEHLWESKQLGAHSPQVLLSTLMFFNTKHFNITTVDEHMLLSFSHIMKHWKRNNSSPGSAGKTPGRNVLLRFYPSQAVLDSNSKKKKVYEQSENEENPLRCPVKLYEFYLSKCPESVKTRNDVFYLQPERSCVPDSPVWYSTMSLGKDTLLKMLRRVKMVKEINMAILK